MYDYTYDIETGGILLNDKTIMMSKEPRPVYAKELEYLGIDKIWNFAKQQDLPYMWAEANHYIYRGKLLFNAKGGSLYQKPLIEIVGEKSENDKYILQWGNELLPIDIEGMCKKNKEILNVIEQVTVKKVYDVYQKYKNKLDCFHVAFSGGKDSIVLLDLVKRALPKSSYIVIFGDTKMEFPDTYKIIDKVEKQCKEEGIDFYRASTHFSPQESWHLFGPPSRVLRWCCTVHKAAPQTLKLREVLKKNDYIGMDFVGIRAQESTARSNYEEINFGKKQKGQFSHNPILEWTSAEIWLYIYMHNLPINETYKKGNSRAGCLFCPMGGGKGDFFQHMAYPQEMDEYIDLVKEMDVRDSGNKNALDSYIINGGWNARKNGRDISVGTQHYYEDIEDGKIIIKVINPRTDWKEWIKTLGNIEFSYDVRTINNGYIVSVDEDAFLQNSTLRRRFKQVFKKSAYCVGCRVCEMNCRNGRISFENGLKITDCLHCGQCHDLDNGCLVYNSIKAPQGGSRKMKSINSFANHAPKPEWIKEFLVKGSRFWDNNGLGPNEIPMFKKFLKAAGILNENNETTVIYNLLLKQGYESSLAWSLIIANLAYNSQFSWYIDNMPINTPIARDTMVDMLMNEGVSKGDTTSIMSSYKRFCELPIGTILNFGKVMTKGKRIETLIRKKTSNVDEIAILYSLYRYAEACEGYYQFTLYTLMDLHIDSVGISPSKIYGIEKDEMEATLRGLSAKYSDFIDTTFTHDLDKISLRDYHHASDVLELFREG